MADRAFTLWIDERIHARAKSKAAQLRISLAQYFEDAVREKLETKTVSTVRKLGMPSAERP